MQDDAFPSTETRDLPEAAATDRVRLSDGQTYPIEIRPVRKRVGDAEIRMLGYNGSIPGPILHVDQGSEVTIEATNRGDVDATIHWHGLRLALVGPDRFKRREREDR